MTARFDITEQLHIVNALPPLDIDTAAQTTDWLNLKNAGVVYFLVTAGVTGATFDITVEEATNAAGDDNVAIAFARKSEETDAGDTLDEDWTAVTSAGFTTSANNNIMYVIRVDASELAATKPYVALQFTDPGAATFVGVFAILGDIRFQEGSTPTAIT